jgi:hypothetical protein
MALNMALNMALSMALSLERTSRANLAVRSAQAQRKGAPL